MPDILVNSKQMYRLRQAISRVERARDYLDLVGQVTLSSTDAGGKHQWQPFASVYGQPWTDIKTALDLMGTFLEDIRVIQEVTADGQTKADQG